MAMLDRAVIRRMHRAGATFADIGRALGVSRERVSLVAAKMGLNTVRAARLAERRVLRQVRAARRAQGQSHSALKAS